MHSAILTKYGKTEKQNESDSESRNLKKRKDEDVYEIFKKLFPDRKVVQINALPLNWNGGGIHCATQQVSKL